MVRIKIAIFALLLTLAACAQSDNSVPPKKPLAPEQVAAVHGKLFRAGPPGQIQAELAHTKGDAHLRGGSVIDEVSIEMPFESRLASLTCQSDVVIVAKTGSGTSHPTIDQGYIYTDWQFTVDRVLKDNPKAPVNTSAPIVVTRSGGVLEIGGRKVYAQPKGFRDFVPGEELLLYLRVVPETGAYSLRTPSYFPASDENLKAAREGVNESAKTCGGIR